MKAILSNIDSLNGSGLEGGLVVFAIVVAIFATALVVAHLDSKKQS